MKVKQEQPNQYDLGILIGRFQIDELHDEHKKLFDEVISRHDKVLVFLGVPETLSTRKNPLDFVTRKFMLDELYGDKITAILPIRDRESDDDWSNELDYKIREIFKVESVVLYGSRDSFIDHYTGKFDTLELLPERFISATEIRDKIKNIVHKCKKFRSGIIYSVFNRFPVVYSTVDVAIMNDDYTRILLGRKRNKKTYCFIGGFVDPTDTNLTHAVRRETHEETGLEICDEQYICSCKIDDWRYRGEEECSIMTHFHTAKVFFGSEKANDDIEEVKWFYMNDLKKETISYQHHVLYDALIKYLDNKFSDDLTKYSK